MDEPKRTKQIAVRITPETFEALQAEGKKLKWSVAKLANEILTDWVNNKNQNGGAVTFIQNEIHNVKIN